MTHEQNRDVCHMLTHGGHVHMAGVCGIGMAGVARLLKARGLTVSGCDASVNRLGGWIQSHGISVAAGHAPAHITADVDWVVRSPAVRLDHPEMCEVQNRGVPLFCRGQVLPALLEGHVSVAVCGTHGKTTTSTLIAQILKANGLDPTWCIGGENAFLGGVAGVGAGPMIVEADESDGTLALYAPDMAVVTNIEFDHMEHFASVEAFEDCFRTFIRQTRRRVVYGADDPRARSLCESAPHPFSYGLDAPASLMGSGLVLRDFSLAMDVVHNGRLLGRLEVPVPGRHNALNALAVTAVCLELGLRFEQIQSGFQIASLPRRRFETVSERHGIRVISDYAHHPSEIAALIRTARSVKSHRFIGVYQPHRFTRTLALGRDFPPSFDGLDELVLCPVYAASEKPLKGGTTWDLYRHVREQRPALNVKAATSLENAWGYLRTQLRAGDLFLVIGAGDVESIAAWAKDDRVPRPDPPVCGPGTRFSTDEPLAGKTGYRVGGAADSWADVGDRNDLAALIQWARKNGLPWHVLGAGRNVLVSDLGVRGLVMRLSGPAFRQIERTPDGVRAGAGVTLNTLLDWMQEQGFAGYEFLEGIPGTVGGAVRMNAGALGGEIGTRVLEVGCMDAAGLPLTIPVGEVGFSYRHAAGLADKVVTDVMLDVRPAGATATIQAEREAVRARRAWWYGLRCAGSVFRNPPGESAGRLIEQCGLKGLQVGGARIYDGHANVIVTVDGALASDVRSLIETVQVEVFDQIGIPLEPEVIFLE